MKNTEKDYEEIVLMGIKIHILKTKVKIYNNNGIPFSEFKSISDKLVNYMIMESFIENKITKVEVITPQS